MRNRNFKLLAIGLLLNAFLVAQNESSCGFMFAQEVARKNFPDYDKKLKEIEGFNADHSAFKQSAVTLTIPVVFHVLHQNGSENISDAQIQSAMAILNRDFRKLNSDTT